MSSEFASSETTPLRQTDSNAAVTTRVLNVNNNVSPFNNNNTVQIETGLSTNHNGNNNRIPEQHQQLWKMDSNRKIIWKMTFDFAILLCVGLPILFFYLWGEPYKRGFFCDDESLRHPFHESTVKNYMLYLIGLVLPLCIIIPMEYYYGRCIPRPSFRFMDFDVPAWVVEAYKQVGVFGFGAASQQLIVDIAKYSIGRLRPHFIEVCQPIMSDGTRCNDPVNLHRYIEEFKCEGLNSTPRMLKEMRLSFPSGHSSFSAFTMVYCAIYLHSRLNWRGSKLLKHFLQFLLFCITWFTALSRISDYKHHWSDVLAGSVIGVIFAILVSQFVSDLFENKNNNKSSCLPTTRQEMTTNLTTSTSPTHQQQQPPYHHQYHNNQNSTNGHA